MYISFSAFVQWFLNVLCCNVAAESPVDTEQIGRKTPARLLLFPTCSNHKKHSACRVSKVVICGIQTFLLFSIA